MPKNKRCNGEGCISKIIDKETRKVIKWRVIFTFGRTVDGKLLRKESRHNTQKEAIAKLKEYQEMFSKGLRPVDDKLTLQQWFHTWLFEYRTNNSRPSTLERYEGIYRNYIQNSIIGMTKIKDLTTSSLQIYYNNLVKKDNKTSQTIRTINKILKCCLNQALKENYIHTNICNNVTLPKIEVKNEVDIFSKEEQRLFLQTIQNHKYKTIFLLALATGLRIGELIALKWSDIDFNESQLSVQRTLKRVRILNSTESQKTKVIEQLPKTKSSIRVVCIPKSMLAELKSYKKKQSEYKLKNGLFYGNDFIFCNSEGNPLDTRNITREFSKILDTTGIPHKKFHSLRHTYATRLFEENEQDKLISVMLGHSSTSITNDIYTHVLQDKKTIAAEKLDKYLIV